MATVTPQLLQPAGVKWVGQSLRRKEDAKLLRGEDTFTDDLHLPGILYCAFVRSPYSHALLGRIDTSHVLKQPDVVAVHTSTDGAKLMPSWMRYPGLRDVERYSLAVRKVRFVGEPVAAVVATDRYAAEDAVAHVRIEYDLLPPVVDAERALKPGSPLLYEDWGDNILLRRQYSRGDVAQAFREADLVIKERLRSHRYTATPIEPRGVLASFEPSSGRLAVWASTQFPHVLRTYLAQTLDFPEHKIHVIAPRVGGGFGPKSNVYPDEITVCQLAIRLGRPVKWIETRTEHMLACAHAREQVHYVEAAFKRDGTLLAVRDRAIADFGVYGPFWTESQPAMLSVLALPGPYRFQNYEYELLCVVTNKAPYGAHRGFGRPVGCYVMERVMDLAGHRLNLDPIEIRLRNLIQPHEFPFTCASGVIYDSGNYPEAMHRLRRLARYRDLRAEQDRLRKEGRFMGIGVATYVEYTAPNSTRLQGALGWKVGGYEVARIRIEPTGKVLALTGVVSQGQSHETVFAQVVADELGINFEDVQVQEGDTDVNPYGFGAWASRCTVDAGGACIAAARKVKDKLFRVAAHMLETTADQLTSSNGVIWVRTDPDRKVTVAEAADRAIREPAKLPPGMEPGMEAIAYFEPEVPTTCSYAMHLCVVEVDAETGFIRIPEYYVVDDCGIVINPQTVYGQVHGAVAHGLGGTIYEDLVYDANGQLLSATFVDYLIPTAHDMPLRFEIDHLETPSLLPGGFKGMGEGGSIPTPAVIANAVEDALAPLGVTVRETPLSPERVRQLIRTASHG